MTNKTLTTPVIAEIDSAGNFTVDAATDIILDADGGDVFLKDAGTTYGSLTNTGGNLIIKSGTTTAMTMSGANVTIAGNLTVSGSTTTVDSSTVNLQTGFVFEGSTADSFETTLVATDPTADRTLTLPDLTGTVSLIDATETLENKTLTTPVITEIDSGSTITLDATTDIILDADGDNITLKAGGTTALDFVLNGATDITLDAPGDIKIDADGGDIFFLDAGTTFGSATNNSGNLIIKSGTTTAATFSGANVTLAGTVDSGAITSSSTVTATGAVLSGSVVFEGSTADSFETTLNVVDPTADRAINLANAAGTLQPFQTASTDQITATVAEVNLMDGGSTVGTTAVADGDGNVTNDGGTMRQTTVQTFATYFGSEITAMSNLVTTGALNSGSITSGFGNIDIGSSTFDTTGAVGTGVITLAAGGATTAGSILFKEGTDNGTNAVTLIGPVSTGDITVTLPTQAGTIVVSNTTDGNDVQLDSLGLNTAASGTAGELRATNDITAFYSSDVSLKENIVEIPSALDMVDKLRGVFFDWKDDYIESKGGEDGYFMRKHDVGFIAQEVEAVLPEVVGTRKDGIKAIKYDRLVPLLLQAIKELKEKI